MHILITGGTGFIGRHLIPHLLAHHHQITVLTRHELRAYQQLGHEIHVITDLNFLAHLNAFDAIINLAGEPIANGRWSQRKKQRICHSRWNITEQLATKIALSQSPPSVFISGSAVGIYGDQGDTILTEQFKDFRNDFAHHVCQQWEQLALAATDNCRVCILRTGLVLGHTGGLFRSILPLFKAGLGGPLGNGSHYQPWIHMHDMVHAIEYLLNTRQCQGVYNLTAPNPVSNRRFSQILATHLHRPCWLKVPTPLLTLTLGELSQLLLSSQRAVPEKLCAAGFHFMFEQLDDAIHELLSHHR
ncbi:TIGR01777 family oxidoreductase [Celerinatantimonas sp. YJH-8]|uniref:TIGR01777 family oxidoreductase n=1 Tax=Celerinatantimonas sp. YJH-8 TaxID=3228714 RepID=UPI0038BE67E7